MTRVIPKRSKGNMFYEALFSPTTSIARVFHDFIDFGTPFGSCGRFPREVPANLLKRKSDGMITRFLQRIVN